jgi:hypothetical protein
VSITERFHLHHYQGFYDRISSGFARGSHTATWGGRHQLSQAAALQQVVNWLWRRHAEATGEALVELSAQDAEEAVRTAVEMRRPQADALPTPGASSSSGTILYYTILYYTILD